jgi:hypothetical protein
VNDFVAAARAALCEAWSSTDQLNAPPELAEHEFLYKEAKKHYLNKDFSIATEYCEVYKQKFIYTLNIKH